MKPSIALPRRVFITATSLSLVGCGSDEPLPNEPGAPAPGWALEDFQPLSERFRETYGLEAFRGSVVLVALYAGWCNTCQGAAYQLNDLVKQWQDEGLNLKAIALNAANALYDQQALIDRWEHPLFQDTERVDAFGQHGGTKDDMFVYTPDGVLSAFLQWGGAVEVYPFTETGRQNIHDAIVAAAR
jgi:thiol-disulfide isomerase/thioredoxin